MFTKSVWSGSYFRSTGVSTARVPGTYIRNSVVGPCLLIVANTQSGSRYRVLGTGQDEGHVSLTDSESVEFEPEQGAEDMQDEVLQFIWLDYYFAREINDVPPPSLLCWVCFLFPPTRFSSSPTPFIGHKCVFGHVSNIIQGRCPHQKFTTLFTSNTLNSRFKKNCRAAVGEVSPH